MKKIPESWIRDNLLATVYVNTHKEKSFVAPFRRLEYKEVPLVLPEGNEIIIDSRKGSLAENVMTILLAKSVRRGPRSLIEPFLDGVYARLQRMIDNRESISLVLPTLPFKDQSPLTTGQAIDLADVGEYALFAQLKRILAAIRRVYEPGAHITLVCDGYVYADIFAGNDRAGAGRYKARCEAIKNEYHLYNEVTLMDMREVLFDMPEWKLVESDVRATVTGLYERDLLVRESLDLLARRFKYHMMVEDCDYERGRRLYSAEPWPSWLRRSLLDAAIRYSSLLLTIKWTDLIARAFPSAIRCTVHPKSAEQLPLHLTNNHNDLLPYNGVATVSREALHQGRTTFQALRVRRLCDVFEFEDVVEVRREGSSELLYYELP